MKGMASKLTPEVMKKLMVIGEKQGTISLEDLSQEMGLAAEDALVFLRQVFPNGAGVEIYTRNNQCLVDIDANALQYMLPLSPAEWLSLHQLLTQVGPTQMQKYPALNTLKKKMVECGPVKAVMELLNQLEAWDVELNERQQKSVSVLDEAVVLKGAVSFTTTKNKHYQVFPWKIIHLEGQLSMIAEDLSDHCMLVMPVSELIEVKMMETSSSPKVSTFEVDEFIAAIRSMSEKETRLILKIHDPQSVNLFPDHHFLGKPCMITNPNGDLIWAAYVEPCDDLFEWLLSLGGNVEILDPSNFKDNFLMYCEEKLRKVA